MIARVLAPTSEAPASMRSSRRSDARSADPRLAAGHRHHYVLADRDVGRHRDHRRRESLDAVQAVAADLEPARERLWSAFGTPPELEVDEVADEIAR